MMALKKENLKTFLLLLLILTSLLQIGIHWYQQAQGFPFRFIEEIFNSSGDEFPSMDVDSIKHRYFRPETIIVSVSSKASLWKLEQNDPFFISIWKDIKDNYLPTIIKEKPTKIIPKDQWSAIISGRCIRIDFAAKWLNDIIFWLEDVKKPRDFKSFNGVRSIAILPQSDVNETVNTVFVYDEDQVYQYQINLKEDYLPKAFYSGLADELNSRNIPRLSVLSANTTYKSGEDILVYLDRGIGKAYSSLAAQIPSAIKLNEANIKNDSIQDHILLNQKESLMAKHDEKFTEALFTDTDNLYTLNKDGILQYRYLPMVDKEAGAASDAFKQALSFIELRRRSLLGDVELVLTYIERNEHYYEMQFEYQLNGVPVYYTGADSESKISPPLIIKANSKRVLECQWVIRFFQSTAETDQYSLYFTDLVEKQILSLYPEIINRENIYFERIKAGYFFGLKDQGDLPQRPHWIISTESKDYFIPLLEEEG